ncbi:F-box domain-containing protein [Mycena venus]|uniref:F-box domain-containing protein n=1 Tax=Mycena venus TaxID=2733690 RepID=A0A8H6XVE2_9AGAR|nr:F-box domain-containing protein [Mycena venus]
MDSLHDYNQSKIPSTTTSAASLRTRLMEIDAEMADLHARLQQLAVARRPVVEALRSIIYPILTLPPEITAEIFKQCVDETITVARANWLGPLVLSSVCRAWRHIGFNLKSIWSNICIPNTYEAIPSLEKVAWWWLPRVGGHPLDLTGPSPMLKALMKYSMQWRGISCPVDIDNSTSLNSIQGRIPLLRRLEITPSRRLYSGPTPITMFSEAPNLREVTLTAGSTGRVSTFITLPWTQLTSFTYWNQSTAQSLELLSLTPPSRVILRYPDRSSTF